MFSHPSSYRIQGRVRLISRSISGFSTLGRPDYEGENSAYEHDSSNHFEGLGILARALAHVRDYGRPTHRSETPRRQHQPINGTNVSRTEKIGGKRRHRPEAPSIAQQDD